MVFSPFQFICQLSTLTRVYLRTGEGCKCDRENAALSHRQVTFLRFHSVTNHEPESFICRRNLGIGYANAEQIMSDAETCVQLRKSLKSTFFSSFFFLYSLSHHPPHGYLAIFQPAVLRADHIHGAPCTSMFAPCIIRSSLKIRGMSMKDDHKTNKISFIRYQRRSTRRLARSNRHMMCRRRSSGCQSLAPDICRLTTIEQRSSVRNRREYLRSGRLVIIDSQKPSSRLSMI